jgi:hypothetical protein
VAFSPGFFVFGPIAYEPVPEVVMSVWSESAPAPLLRGAEGELLSLRITVEPHLLERLLETLARLEFPVNPQICHDVSEGPGRRAAAVEFPAWAGRLAEVRAALRRAGFQESALTARSMLEEIRRGA